MSKLSQSSIKKLQTCHKEIQECVLELAIDNDIQVLEGNRSLERQKQLMAEGKSSIKNASNGKHVQIPSEAVDVAPLIDGKVDWTNHKAFADLADKFLAIAKKRGYKIRWGGDWNRNGEWKDERFLDMVHFERDY